MTAYFRGSWLEDPSFSFWLQKGPNKKTAKRKKCQVCFSLFNMGKRALKNHMNGKKRHNINSISVSCFFQKLPVKEKKYECHKYKNFI